MKLALSLMTIVALLFLTVGCSTNPTAQSAISRRNSIEGDSQLVVLWCQGPKVQTAAVYIDGVERGRLRRDHYAIISIPAGDHEVKFKFVGFLGVGMPSTKDVFHFEKGRKHYVAFSYQYDMTGIVAIGAVPMVMGNTSKSVVEMSPEAAEQLIQASSFEKME